MFKKVEISILAIICLFGLYCALIVGSSWDEIFQMNIGKERLKYIFSFGSYKDYDFHVSRFYPGFYDKHTANKGEYVSGKRVQIRSA